MIFSSTEIGTGSATTPTVGIRVPSVPTAELRDAALRLGRGGVAYSASSDFVHVGVGRVRRW